MRVYHFLSAQHALDNIRRRRIKIATFETLNDPFELWAVSLPDKQIRKALRNWKNTMSRNYGLLCFSRSWHTPVLWSHYADRHRGIALGFEVSDELLRNVEYVKARPPFKTVTQRTMEKLLFTKFSDWGYEEELRIFTRLEERDLASNLFFAEFNDDVALREVICGPLCEVSKSLIADALGDLADVKVIKARLAFRTFRVVADRRGV